MPFDPTPAEVSPNGVEVGKLRVLSEALRGRFPDRFEWDFIHVYEVDDCGSTGCALGLAGLVGLIQLVGKEYPVEAFGLTESETDWLFYTNRAYGCPWSKVTPSWSPTRSTPLSGGRWVVSEGLCSCMMCVQARIDAVPADAPFLHDRFLGPGVPGWAYSCHLCGNKRCPHHTDHRLACTNSNEPGQTGSWFTNGTSP